MSHFLETNFVKTRKIHQNTHFSSFFRFLNSDQSDAFERIEWCRTRWNENTRKGE